MAQVNRRNFMILGGTAAYVAAWQLWPGSPAVLSFEPIAGAPGWRMAAGGALSGAADPMTVGLGTRPAPLSPFRLPEVVHFEAEGPGIWVAVFTDFFCPNCRKMDAQLRALAAQPSEPEKEVMLSWHELPLLGPASEIAARALAAATEQYRRDAFYDALLTKGFKPTPSWFAQVAESAGLDGAKLVQDMSAERVTGRLYQTAAAAARLGIGATPATVVGRKVVLGALDRPQIVPLLSGEW